MQAYMSQFESTNEKKLNHLTLSQVLTQARSVSQSKWVVKNDLGIIFVIYEIMLRGAILMTTHNAMFLFRILENYPSIKRGFMGKKANN